MSSGMSDGHLSPNINHASTSEPASEYQTQIIEDRYLDPVLLRNYLKQKFPGKECRVQVRTFPSAPAMRLPLWPLVAQTDAQAHPPYTDLSRRSGLETSSWESQKMQTPWLMLVERSSDFTQTQRIEPITYDILHRMSWTNYQNRKHQRNCGFSRRKSEPERSFKSS